ncbi:MAG: outer membrane protein assembly factor BamE [Acidiferrobacterales bacterium]
MRIVIVGLLLLMGSLLSGCFSEFRISVPQGNIITPHAIAQLKPGMTKRQVRFVLGSPLIRDPFNRDRWDYYYSLGKLGRKPTHHRLTLFFKGGVLTGADGDLAPATLRAGQQSGSPATAHPASS